MPAGRCRGYHFIAAIRQRRDRPAFRCHATRAPAARGATEKSVAIAQAGDRRLPSGFHAGHWRYVTTRWTVGINKAVLRDGRVHQDRNTHILPEVEAAARWWRLAK